MAKSKLRKLVTPRLDRGPAGLVVPLAIGGASIVVGYVVLRSIAPGTTDAIVGTVSKVVGETVSKAFEGATRPFWDWTYKVQVDAGQWWDSVFGGGSSGPALQLTRYSAHQGAIIGIAAYNLLPNTQGEYGWRATFNFPGYSEPFTASPQGTWYGNGNGALIIAETTPPGAYTIYVDQRPAGGPYLETQFTVLQ
jgi:hypothetical protein